jgi:hypothetical protein
VPHFECDGADNVFSSLFQHDLNFASTLPGNQTEQFKSRCCQFTFSALLPFTTHSKMGTPFDFCSEPAA